MFSAIIEISNTKIANTKTCYYNDGGIINYTPKQLLKEVKSLL